MSAISRPFGLINSMHVFDDIRSIFKISPRTLYRWCRRAGIVVHTHPVDMRRRYLDDDQLLHLARLHNRVLRVDADAIQLSQIERLEARIAELEVLMLNKKGP